MASYVKRFADQWAEKLADVFGSAAAADRISSTPAPHERLELARGEYETSLRRVARFVRYFTMLDRSGHTIYDLFFASNHPLGHLKMKEAMRAVGHGGEFAFRDGVGVGQTALFGEQIPRDVAALVGRSPCDCRGAGTGEYAARACHHGVAACISGCGTRQPGT